MEHLLLAPLGKSPGAVLSLVDWLNAPEGWVSDGRPAPTLPRVTDLWVVTTSHSWILKNSVRPLEREFQTARAENDQLASGLSWRVFLVKGVEEIKSTSDADRMAEVIYRLVLLGEGWRNELETARQFSVSITGGRKTMSGDLQRAATFFEVDSVLQMVFAGEDGKEPAEARRDTQKAGGALPGDYELRAESVETATGKALV